MKEVLNVENIGNTDDSVKYIVDGIAEMNIDTTDSVKYETESQSSSG